MMRKITLLLAALAFLGAQAFAQGELIQFDEVEHDFGSQPEEKETLQHEFNFTNISDKPIKLIYVKASCGCTTPTWTKEAIQPGKNGVVKASYGAKNRPGKFNKTVTVRAANVNAGGVVDSATAQVKILRIKGDVIPRQKGPADWYPFEDGSLRYSTNHVSFGQLSNADKAEKTITLYNQGAKPVTISSAETQPPKDYVQVSFVDGKKTIAPKDSAKLNVSYDASKVNDWDWQHERVYLNTDDEQEARKTLYLSATIVPHFTDAEKQNPPKIKLDKMEHDFGEISESEPKETKFIFTNTGKAPLKILKTKASCGCTATKPAKTELAPGESSEIVVTFNPKGKKGPQHKQVTIVSNDPSQPVLKLGIKAKIQD